MKFATLKTNHRDGQLVIVSRDLKMAVTVPEIANCLQFAIDNWETCKDKLQNVYEQLNAGKIANAIPFSQQAVTSPLPRAYQWADGSAYLNHVELVRKARNSPIPENLWTDPLMYQGGSDVFLGPQDPIPMIDESFGLDFESEVAVITHDVPMGIDEKSAKNAICLIMLVNDISLRNLIPAELAKGFGFFQSKPASTFSPVAITPDELGPYWDGGKVNLALCTFLNDELFGAPLAGTDMAFEFPRLISHAAKTRALAAGTIVGSGTVSNYDRTKGSSCIAEKRMIEILADGKANTPFLKTGDQVRIEMFDEANQSIFGAINQEVTMIEEIKHAKAL